MTKSKFKFETWLVTLIVIGIIIAVNVVFYFIPARVDMTDTNINTLSESTKELLDGLEKEVKLELYVSTSDILPPSYARTYKYIADLLKYYQDYSRNFEYSIIEVDPNDDDVMSKVNNLDLISKPLEDPAMLSAAEAEKIQEYYLGAAIYYDEKMDTIPIFERPEDVEFNISNMIRSLRFEFGIYEVLEKIKEPITIEFFYEISDINDKMAGGREIADKMRLIKDILCGSGVQEDTEDQEQPGLLSQYRDAAPSKIIVDCDPFETAAGISSSEISPEGRRGILQQNGIQLHANAMEDTVVMEEEDTEQEQGGIESQYILNAIALRMETSPEANPTNPMNFNQTPSSEPIIVDLWQNIVNNPEFGVDDKGRIQAYLEQEIILNNIKEFSGVQDKKVIGILTNTGSLDFGFLYENEDTGIEKTFDEIIEEEYFQDIYSVELINLGETGIIPEYIDLLIVTGPSNYYTDGLVYSRVIRRELEILDGAVRWAGQIMQYVQSGEDEGQQTERMIEYAQVVSVVTQLQQDMANTDKYVGKLVELFLQDLIENGQQYRDFPPELLLEHLPQWHNYVIDQYIMRGGRVAFFLDQLLTFKIEPGDASFINPFTGRPIYTYDIIINGENLAKDAQLGTGGDFSTYVESAVLGKLDELKGYNNLVSGYGIELEDDILATKNNLLPIIDFNDETNYFSTLFTTNNLVSSSPITQYLTGGVTMFNASPINILAESQEDSNAAIKVMISSPDKTKALFNFMNLFEDDDAETYIDASKPLAVMIEGNFNSAFLPELRGISEEDIDLDVDGDSTLDTYLSSKLVSDLETQFNTTLPYYILDDLKNFIRSNVSETGPELPDPLFEEPVEDAEESEDSQSDTMENDIKKAIITFITENNDRPKITEKYMNKLPEGLLDSFVDFDSTQQDTMVFIAGDTDLFPIRTNFNSTTETAEDELFNDNMSFFRNLVYYMMDDNEYIELSRPRRVIPPKLESGISSASKRFIKIFYIFILPTIIAAVGITVFVIRRKKLS